MVSDRKEVSTEGLLNVQVAMTTLLPDTADEVIFTDCAKIPYEIKLSDEVNFKVDSRAEFRQQGHSGSGCTHFMVKALQPGASTDVTLTFFEESTGRALSTEATFYSFSNLKSLYPRPDRHSRPQIRLQLSVGTTSSVILQGGPLPWAEEPETFYTNVDVMDDKVISVVRDDDKSKSVKTRRGHNEYSDTHFFQVTCLALGESEFTYTVGNTESDTNELPAVDSAEVLVKCSQPSKITLFVQSDNMVMTDDEVLVDNSQEFELVLTVKDDAGKTFDNVDSLSFGVSLSDAALAKQKEPEFVTPAVAQGGSSGSNKPYKTFVPQGKSGDLELEVKLSGYQQQVLDKAGIKSPPELPKIIADDNEDDENEDVYEHQHHHSLVEIVQIKLVSPEEIQKRKP